MVLVLVLSHAGNKRWECPEGGAGIGRFRTFPAAEALAGARLKDADGGPCQCAGFVLPRKLDPGEKKAVRLLFPMAPAAGKVSGPIDLKALTGAAPLKVELDWPPPKAQR